MNQNELRKQPQVSLLLHLANVKPDTFVNVLRCDVRPESIAFVGAWDALTPKDRELAGVEAVAVSAGILPLRLWELFAGAGLMQGNQMVAVLMATSMADIMKTTIKGAKKAKGLGDREHFYKIARILPTPKGSVTNIVVPGAKAEESTDDDDGTKGDLEPADGFVLSAAKIMNPQKQLPPQRALDEVEATIEGDDNE